MVSYPEEFPQGRWGGGPCTRPGPCVSLLLPLGLCFPLQGPDELWGSWAVGQRWGVSASGHNPGRLGGLTPERYR